MARLLLLRRRTVVFLLLLSSGEWVALFDADGEKTSINFPDGDVRLLD